MTVIRDWFRQTYSKYVNRPLAWLGRLGRKHNVIATFVMFGIGCMVYLYLSYLSTCYKAEFVVDDYLDLINSIQVDDSGRAYFSGSLPDQPFWSLAGFTFQQAIVMMMSTHASIIPIILAPYFWVLWIWRHNDKESSKHEQSIKKAVMEAARLEDVFELIQDEKNRQYGINRLARLMRNQEFNINVNFREIKFFLINVKDKNFTCFKAWLNIKRIYHEYDEVDNILVENLISCHDSLISDSISNNPSKCIWGIHCKLEELGCLIEDINTAVDGNEISLITFCKSKFIVTNNLASHIYDSTKGHVNKSVISWKEYFSNPDYVKDSEFEFDDYSTDYLFLVEILENNPTLKIDLKKYKKERQKNLQKRV